MAMLILHQFSGEEVATLEELVNGRADLAATEEAEPWRLRDGAEVLLVNPRHASQVNVRTPRPDGWPGDLRWLHFRSTGVDRFPQWLLEPPYVTVSRGAQAEAIAEYVLAAMLNFEKGLPENLVSCAADWGVRRLGGLTGRRLGLLGFGRIGREVARRALAFDMEVIAHRRGGCPVDMEGVSGVAYDALLEQSDHLVICAALTRETRCMVDASACARMRPDVHLVNVARGEIVDTEALRDALDDGRIARASLDVTSPEPPTDGHWLYEHPRVRLTPHISFSGPVTRQRGREILSRNLDAYLTGRLDAMHGIVSRRDGY